MNLLNPLSSILRLFVGLLLVTTLHAENWQTFTTRVPAARVGHGFELRFGDVPVPGMVGSLGLQCLWGYLDRQSWEAPTAHLAISIDTDNLTSAYWTLVDTTSGDVAELPMAYYDPEYNPVGGYGPVSWLDESNFNAPAGIPPRRCFLLPEGRAFHPFVLCQPGGAAYPVTVRTDAPLSYYDASAITYRAVYEASATFDPALPFWMLDTITYERTADRVTDLTTAVWTYDPASIPKVGITVLLEGREAGHRFIVYSRGADGLAIPASAIAGLAADAGVGGGYTYDHSWDYFPSPPDGAALTFSVGQGMEFWITRDADGVSSATWIAEMASGGPMLWSAQGVFSDPPQRATPLEPRTFRINSARWGHEFTVWMSDGYRSRFAMSLPAWAMNSTEAWSPYEMAAPISAWDDQGLYNPLSVFAITVPIDPTRAWWLRDDTTGEAFPVGQADVFDGWVPLHAAPAPNAGITLQLPSRLVSSSFRLLDDQVGEIGYSSAYEWRGLNSETFAGLDGMADFTLESFSLSFSHPQPYSTGSLAFQDVSDGSNPVSWQVTRGVNDLRWAFQPTQSLTLTISSSRWDHELILLQPNGDAYPVQKYNTQSGAWFDPAGNAWQQSYYYFDASASHHPELPWYVEDASTSERIGPWPSSEALINWIAVPEPVPYDIALVPGTSIVKFRWSAGSNCPCPGLVDYVEVRV